MISTLYKRTLKLREVMQFAQGHTVFWWSTWDQDSNPTGLPRWCSEYPKCAYVGGCFSDEFTEEEIEFLEARGHHVEKVDVLSWVHGSRRTNNFIIGVKDPRSPDAAGATIL